MCEGRVYNMYTMYSVQCGSCYAGSIVYEAQFGEISEPEKSGEGWDGINCLRTDDGGKKTCGCGFIITTLGDILLECAATPGQGCNEPAAVLLLPATLQGAGLPVQGGGGQVLHAPQAEGVYHTSWPGGEISHQGCFLCWLFSMTVAIHFVGGV